MLNNVHGMGPAFEIMSQVKREQRRAEKIIKGNACGMLESGKFVAETTSGLPVSRRSIERWA